MVASFVTPTTTPFSRAPPQRYHSHLRSRSPKQIVGMKGIMIMFTMKMTMIMILIINDNDNYHYDNKNDIIK